MNKMDLDFFVHGYQIIKFFGMEFQLTTTHVCMSIILVIILIFALAANRAIRKADPAVAPKGFLNVVEMIVERVDGLVIDNMGTTLGPKFANYVGTVFIFILLCNISGVFGLRPPTADYGVTLPLALITFFLIQYNGIKAQKWDKLKGLFEPIFLFFPINLISEAATPLSMSLRLFGNLLSGTVMMALIYGLIPNIFLFAWPAALHLYLDVFAGALQAFVFSMLTMVFIKNAVDD